MSVAKNEIPNFAFQTNATGGCLSAKADAFLPR